MKLDELKIGECANIVGVNGDPVLRHHLLDMGLVSGTQVLVKKAAPMGDPIQVQIWGYNLSLRLNEAHYIEVETTDVCPVPIEKQRTNRRIEHPGVGESSNKNRKYEHKHRKAHKQIEAPTLESDYICKCDRDIALGKEQNKTILQEKEGQISNYSVGRYNVNGMGRGQGRRRHQGGRQLEEGERIVFALAGNQNCGKTTLFNQLTGANQHVGNFPGVTVDRKEGEMRNNKNVFVTDLPGVYSISPYSKEEVVTREFLVKERPEGIINIIDATNIERNLYLTMQLIELNIPMVLALNMMDEVHANGGTIMINALESLLGIPVIPISAVNNEGIDELVEHAVNVARKRIRPLRMDFCDANGDQFEQSVHRCIHAISHTIEDHAKGMRIPPRYAATKLVEGDQTMLKQLRLDDNEMDAIHHIIKQLEEESGQDAISAIVKMRFAFIEKLCSETVVHPRESREQKRSQAIDRLLTGKYTAIPAFIAIMAVMFAATFKWIAPALTDLINIGIGALTDVVDQGLTIYNINPVVHSLVIDGIFAGVGSVLSFLPVIVVLFFFLSIIEDSGYMARVAFVMDKPLRKIGLSGRSIVAMLIGFGCSVPAIMATRTLSSERDRKMTIFLIPFMSCSAKLPIYVLFASAFFPEHQGLLIISIYIMGVAAGILYGILMKNTKFKGNPIPFVMELPNYRMPSLKSVTQLLWEKSKDFITKAFTIIFLASIVIWFLQTFDTRFNVVADSSNSLLALIGGWIAPIFGPLGFGDWRASTALLTGFVAKESVVSTITVLLGGDTALLKTLFTPLTSFVFLTFTLYYTPCVAAIAAVRKELNSAWATIGVIIMQCGIAWILAFLVRLIGLALGFQ